MYFLGIDSGTQSTKCVVLDSESGKIVAQAQESYELISGLPTGHMEQHPQDWIKAVDATVSKCLEELGESKVMVRGIGVSGQQHGLVVLDENDEVVRPAKLWCDTSTAKQCETFRSAFRGDDGLIRLAGNTIMPGYTAPKILWLKDNEPENFEKVHSILLPHDYLNFYLTGVKRMEYGDASGTALLDVRTRTWCKDLINFIHPSVAEMLPEVGSSLEMHGELKEELRKRWGLPVGVIVSAGGGDNMMGAIGTGNTCAGVITASFGTSGTLYGCADESIVDPNGEIAAFCDSTDQWLPLICTMNVTVTTEQVRNMFKWDHAALEAAVKEAKPGADGLTFLPYLTGERTPNLPNGKGVIHGLTTKNMTAPNLARSAMESVTLGLAYGLGRFRELGLEPTEIRLTGGGSKSAVWRQISADCFGVPVVTLSTSEGASLGAAIQAAYVAAETDGKQVDYETLCRRWVTLDESTRCEPNPDNLELYRNLLEQQLELTQVLKAADYL